MSKLWLLLGVAAACATAGAAGAQSQDEAAFRAQMIARCGTIAKKSARNACYDAANAGPVAPPAAAAAPAPALPAAPPMTAAPASAPVAAAPAAPAAASQDAFGQEQLRVSRRPERKVSDEIQARVAEASDGNSGYWLITLDSGARWRVQEHQSDFRPPRPNDLVRIKRGALGGYLMAVDRQAFVRVERVD
jgi:hypothetical protein